MDEPKVYCITQMFDGVQYGNTISARSWEEAEDLASRIGATVDGLLEIQTCQKCGEMIVDRLMETGSPFPEDSEDKVN